VDELLPVIFVALWLVMLVYVWRRSRAWGWSLILLTLLVLGLSFVWMSAPGTPGTQADPVAAFWRERMQPASAAFFVPSPIKRYEPVEARLEVRPPDIDPQELQQLLEKWAGRPGVGAAGQAALAPRMVARIVTDRDCTIDAKDPPDQAVDFTRGSTWRWTVTPKTGGLIKVTVSLTTPVIIDGRETSFPITSFEKTVTVTVTNADRAQDVLDWAKEYWGLLAALGGGLAGLVGWVQRRRKRRGTAGFSPGRPGPG